MSESEAKPLLVLPLLRDDFTTKNYDSIVFRLSSAIAFAIVMFLLIKYTPLTTTWGFGFVVFFLALLLLFLMRRLMPDWVKTHHIVGTCMFYSNKVEVKTKSKSHCLELTKSSIVNITSSFYRGLANGRYSTHNGILSMSVIENGRSIKINTVLRTKQEYELMIGVLKVWYKTGVPIHEHCTEEQLNALLLKTNYTYAELKAAKAELGIS